MAAFVPCGWVYTVPTGAQTHAISDMVKPVILVRSATLNPMSRSAPPSNRRKPCIRTYPPLPPASESPEGVGVALKHISEGAGTTLPLAQLSRAQKVLLSLLPLPDLK
ncbi:MAG: hypothetical protein WCE81_12055 [Halobacteriota archaeon]